MSQVRALQSLGMSMRRFVFDSELSSAPFTHEAHKPSCSMQPAPPEVAEMAATEAPAKVVAAGGSAAPASPRACKRL